MKYKFQLSINQINIMKKTLNINNNFIALLFAYWFHIHFG